MKKTAKALVTLIFCLSILCTTLVPAFAASVGQVKGLKATSVTYNGATLTWSKVSKATRYVVQTQSGKDWKDVATVKTNSYNVTKLTTGKTYKYRVYAKNTWGQKGSASATVSVKPMPTKVSGLKASVTYNSAKLTWTKVAGATGYVVQRYDAKKKTWVKIATVKTNTYTNSKLTINTTYKYRVAAYRTVSNKNYYGAYSATLSAKPVLGKTTGLKASIASPTSVKLTWTKVANATGYQVQRYDAKTKKWVKIATVKTNTYTNSKLTPNTTYKYRIISYITISKKTYTGAVSSEVSAKPAAGKPTGVKAAVASPSSVKITWSKVANASSYAVQKYDTAKKAWATVKNGITATSYTVANLNPNTTYKFRVLACATVSGKNYYGAASAEVSAKPTLGKAAGLKASIASATSVKLTWSKLDKAEGYKVEQYNGSKWVVVKDKITATSYTVANLTPNATYKFRVAGYVTVNKKPYYTGASNEVSANLKIATPSAVTISAAETKDTLRFTWGKVNNINGYVFEINKNGKWESVKVNTNSYTATGLTSGTSYQARVRAYATLNSKDYYSSYTATLNAKTAPEKVTSAIAADVQDKTAQLAWNAVPGADGYTVYKINAAGNQEAIGNTTATKIDIKDLAPSTSYKYVVKAYVTSNGKNVYGVASDEIAFTTYFDAIENIRLVEPTNYFSPYYQFRWDKIERIGSTGEKETARYEVQILNSDGEWEKKSNPSFEIYQYPVSENENFKITEQNIGDRSTTIAWTPVENSTEYYVQIRAVTIGTPASVWQTITKTAGNVTTAKVYLAPDTEFEVRVLACNGNFRIRASFNNGEETTAYREFINLPYSSTETVKIKTKPAPAFNKSDKEVKTLYALMAVQAINNTKHEQGKVTVDGKIETTAKIDSVTIGMMPDKTNLLLGMKKGEYWERTFNNIDTLIGLLKLIDPDFDDSDMIEDSAMQNSNIKATFVNGVSGNEYLSKVIAPENFDAYLYDQCDINSIDKKISDINVSEANGVKTIKLTLAKEVVNKDNPAANVCNGFFMGESDLGTGSDDLSNFSSNFGPSVITMTINSNGTLNSLNVASPISFSTSFNMNEEDQEGAAGTDLKLSASMVGNASYDYKFQR